MPSTGARRIRRAETAEAGELEAIQSRSSTHWGYPPGYFDWGGRGPGDPGLLRPGQPRSRPGGGRQNPGFYGLTEKDGGLVLHKLFVDADAIGEGHGRLLRQHAVRTARARGHEELIIGSDPNAAPFYAAMGAVEYATKPTPEPSWTLHMFRYPLTG
ncbi:GNAT family N-acetyltransferase [Streptomyces albidoflavus]